jgi:hypothetical protein
MVAVSAAVIISIASLALVLSGAVKAGPGAAPASVTVAPTVMSYQGLLSDPDTGLPLADGTYNMRFEIYDAPAGGTQLWEEPVSPAVIPVQVTNGVFTVLFGDLVPLTPSIFAGGNTYLEVEVDGQTLAPRQQILSVAYAMVAETVDGLDSEDFSLVGHDHFDEAWSGATDDSGLQVTNTSTGIGRYGLKGVAGSSFGFTAAEETGVVGESADGHGVFGASETSRGVEGYSESGIGVFAGTLNGIALQAAGDVVYSGALIGAFPRPAYDSGFLTYAAPESKTLEHNVGGDPDDYVVDMQCKFAGLAHNFNVGQDENDEGNLEGAAWDDLTSSEILVLRFASDPFCQQIRVRIWEIE